MMPATRCCASSPSASRKNLRGIDLPCRFGGEEFVVVMPDTDIGIAMIVAERIRRRIERDLFAIQGQAVDPA